MLNYKIRLFLLQKLKPLKTFDNGIESFTATIIVNEKVFAIRLTAEMVAEVLEVLPGVIAENKPRQDIQEILI